MSDDNSGKNQNPPKNSVTNFIMTVGIAIVMFSLLFFVPRVRSPWNIILIADIIILVTLQLLLLKKVLDEREKFERNNTILQWEEPRKAWHIIEARWFSPPMLALFFLICFILFISFFAIVLKFDPPANPNRNTLTLAKLPAFSAIASTFLIALYASLWWWAHLRVMLTTSGIERIFHNSSKTWKYDQIKNYSFESLRSEEIVYNFFVLRNLKGKTWKIAVDQSIDTAKLEEIFKERGIPKLEQVL